MSKKFKIMATGYSSATLFALSLWHITESFVAVPVILGLTLLITMLVIVESKSD